MNDIKAMNLAQRLMMVQLKMEAMSRDKQGYNYKYFDINQILDKLKPLLKEHGLVVTQPLTHIDGVPALTTILMSGDERLEFTTPLPTNKITSTDAKGVQTTFTDPQKMGAVITYYRRYALQSLFLMEAEDSDGK